MYSQSTTADAFDRKLVLSTIVAVFLWLALCTNAVAQKPVEVGDFPNRPIRFIIGFLPGGVSDTIARVISDKLARELEQPVTVDSRPGSGGVVGMEIVANARPDGYTWYLGQPVLGISRMFKNKPSFDPLKALAPLALLGTGPTVLVAHPSLPVKTVKELISFAKAQREPLFYGSSAAGSTNYLAGALFAVMANIRLTSVPYKGAAGNTIAVLQGEIPLAFQPLAAAMPYLQSRRLRGIAVTGAKRSKAAPDLPTVAETLPDYRVEAWYGIVVPEKTPQPIIQYLNIVTNKVLAMPEIANTLLKRGLEVQSASPKEFGALIQEDALRWEKLVRRTGIQFD